MKWIGSKKIAFIPVFRDVPPPTPAVAVGAVPDVIPADLEVQLLKKIQFDPQVGTGLDRSFRAWVRTASSGLADVEAVILPMKTVSRWEVAADIFEGEMRNMLNTDGFDHAAIVMLDGGGPTNSGFWSRVGIKGSTGSWAMEVMHGITGIMDFYPFNNDTDPAGNAIDSFDEMSAASLTHPTAFTKAEVGWLDASLFALQESPFSIYDIQYIGLPQPPMNGEFSTVKIGSHIPYLLVEARKRNDQFESGIKSEGVIVYRVQTDNPYRQQRPNGQLPLFLITTTALKLNEGVTVDNGCVVRVDATIPGGFKVYIENPTRHLIDRTGGIPKAIGSPTACVVPGTNEQFIAYRDHTRCLQELWRNSSGHTSRSNLTERAAGAPKSGGNPCFYTDGFNSKLLIFVDDFGTIYSLYGTTELGHDNLGGTAIGSPSAASDLVAYYVPLNDTNHVIYRSSDDHLHELSWVGVTPVTYGGNLTQAISAPKAVGNPCAFATAGGVNIVIYRSVDGQILSLYWKDGGSNLDYLSSVAGTPAPNSDPVGYYTRHNEMHQVVYLGNNGHLYELYWQGNNIVQARDLTQDSGAPPLEKATITAYYSADTNTKHVVYCSANSHLHEIWWSLAGSSALLYRDLTNEYALPPAADRPVGFATEGQWQHVVYRGTDSHIYEVVWKVEEVIF